MGGGGGWIEILLVSDDMRFNIETFQHPDEILISNPIQRFVNQSNQDGLDHVYPKRSAVYFGGVVVMRIRIPLRPSSSTSFEVTVLVIMIFPSIRGGRYW